MYYEEKVINGQLYYRLSPKAKLAHFTYADLLSKYLQLKEENKNWRDKIEDLAPDKSDIENQIKHIQDNLNDLKHKVNTL